MGWKIFSVMISQVADVDQEALLATLGFTNLIKKKDEPYEIAIYPDKGKVFIGKYKDTLIISQYNFPKHFFTVGITRMEAGLIDIFSRSEICAVSLHSATNYWAYAIIKDGKKIRARMGNCEGTKLDFGEPVAEELDLLSKSSIDKLGRRQYKLEDSPNRIYAEEQIGEDFVIEMYRRYTGERLDENDELLFETNFSCNQTINHQMLEPMQEADPALTTLTSKPWWKFW